MRNPGRTTATATALLIGVTLVSMMMVGAQTAKASLDEALGSEYLVDVEVGDYSGSTFTAESLAKVKAMNGVQALSELTYVGNSKSGQEIFATDPGDAQVRAQQRQAGPGCRPGPGLLQQRGQDHGGHRHRCRRQERQA